jgi:hypothetical protein
MRIKKLGDQHFSDFPTTREDERLGDQISYVIGDTFLNFMETTPKDQWVHIAKALRVHGLRIVEQEDRG